MSIDFNEAGPQEAGADANGCAMHVCEAEDREPLLGIQFFDDAEPVVQFHWNLEEAEAFMATFKNMVERLRERTLS